ncbi:MAG: AbrB/MazE/SpoVT family DNA-binding domain-containing protein [Acidimicrobiia bacterium]
MRVVVDRVGRIVIPKVFRVALGIGPDAELEMVPDGAGLRLEPVQRRERAIGESDGLPLLERVGDETLTDDDVRRLRDDLQR